MLSLSFAVPGFAFNAFASSSPASRIVATQMNLAEGTLNVGVIGAGRIGIVHLEALASCSNAKPIIISNPTISKAEAAAAKYPGMEFTGSDMDVINHPDVEAVWICSPSQFHSDQSIIYPRSSSTPGLFAPRGRCCAPRSLPTSCAPCSLRGRSD